MAFSTSSATGIVPTPFYMEWYHISVQLHSHCTSSIRAGCEEHSGQPLPLRLPDGESEVSWVALTGSSQKAAMDAPGQEQLLGLNSADIGMKPPAKCKCDM